MKYYKYKTVIGSKGCFDGRSRTTTNNLNVLMNRDQLSGWRFIQVYNDNVLIFEKELSKKEIEAIKKGEE